MSITLTNPVTVSSGAGITETDASAAITLISIDFVHQTVGIVMQNGTVSGKAFIPGTFVPMWVELTMDLTTGNWTTSSGLSGTASPAVLAAVGAVFTNTRNNGEQFMLNNGAVAGTYVAWS